MAGIYIHIPFCKKACHYCNFHFSTSLKTKDLVIQALIKEINLRKSFTSDTYNTIYFGGGTPSLLDIKELEQIVSALYKDLDIANPVEFTLEANPDDLSLDRLMALKSLGINRLSIGVQSFFEEDLKWMNRSHDSRQASQCIEDSFKVGIDNFSIDLIFGSPTTTNENWIKNLETSNDFGIKHLSCYGLTVEEHTALHQFIKTGKVHQIDDNKSLDQFNLTMDFLKSNGYTHYEISNYCLDGYHSKHNSNYWTGVPYLGLGPSAHSFQGFTRSWNIAHNIKYYESIQKGELPSMEEVLTEKDKFNEYLMTSLRTSKGCSLKLIESYSSQFSEHFSKVIQPLVDQDVVILNDGHYTLVDAAKAISDTIISDLFFIDSH